jgi:translation initiation factor eIF-2B subunit alpha
MSIEMEPSSTIEPFDIAETYHRLLSSDADITMPVAAIESLVLALSHSSTSTITETLEYIKEQSNTLIGSIPNSISLSAGTDLFQRYLISSLRGGAGPGADFEAIRSHLLRNGRLFVERAKASRDRIATFGRAFVRDGKTILTTGGSRVVGALLREAAESSHGSIRFKVIYVLPAPPGPEKEPEGTDIVASLRHKGVPVATIPEGAVAYSMGKVDTVILGAEGIVENGGAISRLGTYQIAALAKPRGKPVYVVAESHKFVRLFPLNQFDLPIEQRIIDFRVENGEETEDVDEGIDVKSTAEGSKESKARVDLADAVDFTVSDHLPHLDGTSGLDGS